MLLDECLCRMSIAKSILFAFKRTLGLLHVSSEGVANQSCHFAGDLVLS